MMITQTEDEAVAENEVVLVDKEPQFRLGELFRSRKEAGVAGLPVLSVTMNDGLVHRDTLDRKTDGKLAPDEHLLIRKGDLAYNMMRMWQGASGSAKQDGVVSPAYVVVTPSDAIDPTFASYWFKSARMIHLFWAYSYGITGDRLRLYYKDFAKIPVTVPPKSDQIRIGKMLAAADRAIARTEDLIAAKRRLKKGLAQRLTIGKLRFSDFRESWTRRSLGSMGNCVSGGTPDTRRAEYWGGEHVWCTPSDIPNSSPVIWSTERTITDEGLKASSATLVPSGVLIVCTRASVGECAIAGIPLATNQGVKSLVFGTDVCPEFIYYSLVEQRHVLERLASGSTFPEVSKKDFVQLELSVPQQIEEQQRIAVVLGCLDRHVELLQTKLTALREIKRGLVQGLFSGPIQPKSD